MTATPRPSTPCVNICKLDDATKLCLGCGRTVEEIVAWGRMSEVDRLALMAALPERLRQMQTDS